MKKLILALAGVAVLVVPIVASAGSPTDRATGGGQILVANQNAGSTIAFTAQGTPTEGKGQVQVIDRSAGTGKNQVKFHGIVECIFVDGDMAEIAGVERGTGDPFTLRAVDNGEGANATGSDMIFFDDVADDMRCANDDNDDDDVQVALARGNVQVYDAP